MSFACSYFKEEIWAVGGYNRGSPLDTVEILTTRDGHVPLFPFVSFYIIAFVFSLDNRSRNCLFNKIFRFITEQSFSKFVRSIKTFVQNKKYRFSKCYFINHSFSKNYRFLRVC